MPLGANKAAIMGVAGTSAAADVVLLNDGAFSNQTTVSFTSELTSTYKEYIFAFYSINPATDNAVLQFNLSDDTSSHSYDLTKTSTVIQAELQEDHSSPFIKIMGGLDLANATGIQKLTEEIGNGADEAAAGFLQLFNPADTTYATHWMSTITYYWAANGSFTTRTTGYANVTAAVTAIQFSMSSGNFDGEIKLWGVK